MSEMDHDPGYVQIGSIVIRCYAFERMLKFWQAALHYIVWHRDEGFVILQDPYGKGPNISLDQVPIKCVPTKPFQDCRPSGQRAFGPNGAGRDP